MSGITLEDHRATHFLVNLIHTQLQGWHAREELLLRLGHPGGHAGRLEHLGNLVGVAAGWRAELRPDATPFVCNDGTVHDPERISTACDLLSALYDELAEMGGRVTSLLALEQPLAERLDDTRYLLACVAWCVVALDTALHADVAFGEAFGDEQLLQEQSAELGASQEDMGTLGILRSYLEIGVTPDSPLFGYVRTMAERLPDGDIKNAALSVGRYLKFFGRSPWPG